MDICIDAHDDSWGLKLFVPQISNSQVSSATKSIYTIVWTDRLLDLFRSSVWSLIPLKYEVISLCLIRCYESVKNLCLLRQKAFKLSSKLPKAGNDKSLIYISLCDHRIARRECFSRVSSAIFKRKFKMSPGRHCLQQLLLVVGLWNSQRVQLSVFACN